MLFSGRLWPCPVERRSSGGVGIGLAQESRHAPNHGLQLAAVKESSAQTPGLVAERRRRVMTSFDALTGGDYSHENVIRVNREQNV